MKWKPTKGKMIICETMKYGRAMNFNIVSSLSQPFKINLDKKLDPKQKTIQAFNIDA